MTGPGPTKARPWPQAAAADYLLALVKRERTAGRRIEAGALAATILVDGAWSARGLFTLALRDHLNFTPDEAEEACLEVLRTSDPESGDACDHCGLALSIPDVLIPYRLADHEP